MLSIIEIGLRTVKGFFVLRVDLACVTNRLEQEALFQCYNY